MTLALMIDLETLSSRPDAAIIAIGAYAFNEEAAPEATLDPARAFYCTVTPDPRAHIDPDTILWWMQQSQTARDSVTQHAPDLFEQAWCPGAQFVRMPWETSP